MSTTLKLKRSSQEGNVPTLAQLDLGELAINTYDGKIYLKKDDGSASIQMFENQTEINISKSEVIGFLPGNNNGTTGSVYFDPDLQAVTFKHVTGSANGVTFRAIEVKKGDRVKLNVRYKANTLRTGTGILKFYLCGNTSMGAQYTHLTPIGSANYVTYVSNGTRTNSLGTTAEIASYGATPTSWTELDYEYISDFDGHLSWEAVILSSGSGVELSFKPQEFRVVGSSLNEVIALRYALG